MGLVRVRRDMSGKLLKGGDEDGVRSKGVNGRQEGKEVGPFFDTGTLPSSLPSFI
jgi:hypothetical protein